MPSKKRFLKKAEGHIELVQAENEDGIFYSEKDLFLQRYFPILGMKEKAGDAADVLVDADNAPFYVGLDNPAVQACIESYNLVTGEHAVPMTIGGGTYARHFSNAVAFGPEHPERPCPEFCGPIHGVDEAARLSDFLEALKIYIVSLLRLETLDF